MDATDIAPLVERMRTLQRKGLTAPMVVKEFVRRRIAPLQSRERLVWEYRSAEDRMRLSDTEMSPEDLAVIMNTLVGKMMPPELSKEVAPLYCLRPEARPAILTKMPTFDRWDLLGEGLASRQENLPG